MTDWWITEQKIFLIFLTERSLPFPEEYLEKKWDEFCRIVYTAMGVKKVTPQDTKANISNLFWNIRKGIEPDWLAAEDKYAPFFQIVTAVYGEGKNARPRNSISLPEEWIKEKNRLLEECRQRLAANRFKKTRWARCSDEKSSGFNRAISLPPQALLRERSVAPKRMGDSFMTEEVPFKRSDSVFKTPQGPPGIPQNLFTGNARGSTPMRAGSSSYVASSRSANRTQPVYSGVQSTAKVELVSPSRQPQSSSGPLSPPPQNLASVLAANELNEAVKNIATLVKENQDEIKNVNILVTDSLARQADREEEAAKKYEEWRKEAELNKQRQDNLEMKMDRITHAIDILLAGLIGRGFPAQAQYPPRDAPAYVQPPQTSPLPAPIHRAEKRGSLKAEEEDDVVILE